MNYNVQETAAGGRSGGGTADGRATMHDRLVEESEKNNTSRPSSATPSPASTDTAASQQQYQLQRRDQRTTTTTTSASAQLEGLVQITKKSSLDVREYASLTLPNGLQALLVSDPETTEAGVSMDVHVGYFNDPKDVAGLCHFLEHMLFLGTEKYPDEKEYKTYLAQHGGHSNASTAAEHTSYYFNVNADYIEGTLDRFASFFTCPLFTESSTRREMEAVNAEFRRNLHSDSRRILQVMKHTANQENPFSNFSTGNIDTLAKYDVQYIRNLLLEKHRQFYTADNSKLCVIGRESIEELKELVTSKFSDMRGDIQNMKPVFGDRAPRDTPPFLRNTDVCKMHKIVPINEMRSLSLYWELPSQYHNADKKTLAFISELLDQQSPGSLFQYLKNEKHWINGLGSGVYSSSTVLALFKISISLTEEGLQHTEEIMRHVFEMLRLISLSLETDRGYQIYAEMKRVYDISFRFLERSSPLGYAKALANRLHVYHAEEILSMPYDFQRYDPDNIKSILNLLTPRRMRSYISAKEFENELIDPQTLQSEPIYGTKFTEESLPVKLIEDLSAVKVNPKFKLPPENVFIPARFDVRTPKEDAPFHPVPVSMIQEYYHLLWYNERTEFQHPYVDIVTRMAMSHDYVFNVRGALLLQAFVSHIHNSLSDVSYQAAQADASYGVSYDAYEGIEVSFSGFSDKLPELVKIVFEHIRSPQRIEEASFNRIKDNLKRQYENYSKQSAMEQTSYMCRMITQDPIYHYERYLNMIQTITVDELQQFIVEVQRRMKLETFVNGNMSQEEAQNLMKVINEITQHESMDGMEETPGGIMTLSLPVSSKEYVLQVQNTNESDGNAAVLVHYQIGERSVRKKVLTELFNRVVRSSFFDEMRTKQQLGYSVHSNSSIYEDVITYEFEVMAPKHSAPDVHARINRFIKEKIAPLLTTELSDETFEEYRAALMDIKRRPRKRMSEETSALLAEIAFRRFEWTRMQDEVEELKTLTKQDLLQFFEQHFTPAAGEMKKLSVLVYDKEKPLHESTYRQDVLESTHGSTMTFIDSDSIQEFKSTCGRYPLHLRKPLKSVLPESLLHSTAPAIPSIAATAASTPFP